MTRPAAHRSSGFTILEIVIAMGTMLVVAGAAFSVLSSSSSSLVEGTSGADLQSSARRVLNRIGEDFRKGILSTLALPDPRSASVHPAMGYVDGEVIQGVTIGYQLKADPRDPPNGIDDDGDGSIDEKLVVRTEGGVETTIAGHVKDLTFSLSGNILTCSVTLERTIRGRHMFQHSDSIQVRLRN